MRRVRGTNRSPSEIAKFLLVVAVIAAVIVIIVGASLNPVESGF